MHRMLGIGLRSPRGSCAIAFARPCATHRRLASPAWRTRARWSRLTRPIWRFGRAAQRSARSIARLGLHKSGKSGPANKRAVVALVERGGKGRMFHVANATADEVHSILVEQRRCARAHLHTDESRLYTTVGATFSEHHTVKHSAGEYVRRRWFSERTRSPSTRSTQTRSRTSFPCSSAAWSACTSTAPEKHLHRYLSRV